MDAGAVSYTHLGKTAPKRFWLVMALAANLLVLGFYKYQGFLAENINRACLLYTSRCV